MNSLSIQIYNEFREWEFHYLRFVIYILRFFDDFRMIGRRDKQVLSSTTCPLSFIKNGLLGCYEWNCQNNILANGVADAYGAPMSPSAEHTAQP
jgi:hypothetical protein